MLYKMPGRSACDLSDVEYESRGGCVDYQSSQRWRSTATAMETTAWRNGVEDEKKWITLGIILLE